MTEGSMESIVYCPECGSQVSMVIYAYSEAMTGLTAMLERAAGIGKTTHYSGEARCGCGKNIAASLHVTCREVTG